VHGGGGRGGFFPAPGEKLFCDLVLFIKVEDGYIFVAAGD